MNNLVNLNPRDFEVGGKGYVISITNSPENADPDNLPEIAEVKITRIGKHYVETDNAVPSKFYKLKGHREPFLTGSDRFTSIVLFNDKTAALSYQQKLALCLWFGGLSTSQLTYYCSLDQLNEARDILTKYCKF